MSKPLPEPCLCGAPDCPRCFPGSWWRAVEWEDWIDYAECRDLDPNDNELFEKWRRRERDLLFEAELDRALHRKELEDG